METKNNFIYDLMGSMQESYKFDLYEQKFIMPTGIKSQKNYIDNTLITYKNYHKEFNFYFLNAVKNTLYDIVKNDIVISLDNKIILKELYKIIFLIDSTNRIINFISRKNYPKKYFADYQSDSKEIKRVMKSHKGMIVNSRTKLISKGEHRINWWFHNILNKNKKLTKFYLNMITMIDFERCTFLENEDEVVVERFFNFVDSKIVQIVTSNVVLKSLSILLYHQLKDYLKIKKKDDLELYVSILMEELYNYTPNFEEFNRIIYLRSTVNYFPIFGAKRTSEFNKKEKEFIRANILKDRKLNKKKDFDYKGFDISLELIFKKPHSQFLLKYPVEFFRRNPKYSTSQN